MANKKSFVLRMDEDVFKALEKWSADDFRSVNGQIEWIINQQLKNNGRLKETKEKTTNKVKKGKN
ncbi:MAG: Arc family DNA-binding protein [Bacteroidetes bacterium]|nr:Arc family DNA-binding protein [Bacteroidota bacterium]